MPTLIRLYIRQVLVGFGLSAVFVAMLLHLDVARLGQLVANSDVGGVAVIMLWVFNGIVFAGVQFAMSIMRLSDNTPSGGARMKTEQALLPVRVDTRSDRNGPRNLPLQFRR
jgi:hypothetical protein